MECLKRETAYKDSQAMHAFGHVYMCVRECACAHACVCVLDRVFASIALAIV